MLAAGIPDLFLGVAALAVGAAAPPVGITVLATGAMLAAAVAHHVWTSRENSSSPSSVG